MSRVLKIILVAALAAPSFVLLAAPGQAAAPKPPRYKNCAALNAVHPHGIARPGAVDIVRGKTKPVKKFKVTLVLYTANTHLDRDKDGVACEKR